MLNFLMHILLYRQDYNGERKLMIGSLGEKKLMKSEIDEGNYIISIRLPFNELHFHQIINQNCPYCSLSQLNQKPTIPRMYPRLYFHSCHNKNFPFDYTSKLCHLRCHIFHPNYINGAYMKTGNKCKGLEGIICVKWNL
jgi:hypothetical protein